MRSRTSRGVPEWSENEDLYIGSWYLDSGRFSGIAGSVPGVTNGFRGPTGWAHHAPRGTRGFTGCTLRHNGLANSSKEIP